MKKWLFLFSIFLLTACSQKVISYVDTNAKFQNFNSFRVVSAKFDGRKVEPENDRIFSEAKNQIIDQMLARSYVQSNITPDLTLRYEFNSSTRNLQNNNNNNFNNPFSYPSFNTTNRTIYESIILIELYDANKKLVWQGSYDLKNERKEEKASKVIKNALDQIFTTYPYTAGSKEINEELMNVNKNKKKE